MNASLIMLIQSASAVILYRQWAGNLRPAGQIRPTKDKRPAATLLGNNIAIRPAKRQAL